MPEQYVATDKRTGVQVAVTGEFPPHPDDRVRIARTTTLFTRLMSTILGMSESDRRAGFRAIETQLELADALIRQDMEDVRRLVRQTMESMGITQDQLDDLARQLRNLSGLDEMMGDEIARALGLDRGAGGEPGGLPAEPPRPPATPPPSDEAPPIEMPPPAWRPPAPPPASDAGADDTDPRRPAGGPPGG